MEELLPFNIKSSDVISLEAKMVLASLLNYQRLNPRARNAAFVAISNPILAQSVGLRVEEMLGAVGELEEHNLIKRIAGQTRTKGEKAKASEYYILWESLTLPLRKLTFEELYSEFLESSGTPLGTAITTATTIAESESNTDVLDSDSNTDSNTNTVDIDEDIQCLPF